MSGGEKLDAAPSPGGDDWVRADRWLFFARFCKSRSIAAQLCQSGRLRISGQVVSKANHKLRVGDVVSFSQGRFLRIVRVERLGARRGPASEAQTLYADLKPLSEQTPVPRSASGGLRERGEGRPTKKDRRALDKLLGSE